MAQKSRGLARLLMPVLGIVLLVYVLWQVDWRDSLVLLDGTRISGQIVRDVPPEWDQDTEVVFRPVDGEDTAFRIADIKTDEIAEQVVPSVNEGILSIVRRSDPWLLCLGMLAYGFSAHFGIWRWWLLLESQGIRVSFWLAHKLTFLGMFFNNVVPGATGGDLVKAVYLTRHTEQGARSFGTVLVDRVTGIVALALIAAVAIATQLDNPNYQKAAVVVFGFLGCFALGCVVFFSRRIRRVLRVDAIAARLPGGGLLKKFDDACFAYRHHKRVIVWAMVLSFANQLAIQGIMILFAAGLNITNRSGAPVSVTDYMVILPVGFIVAAIPALPGGWGIREGAFAVFFHHVGVGRNQAVALSVLSGLMMLVWSLLGGVYFLLGRAGGDPLTAAGDDGGEPATRGALEAAPPG